MVISFKTRVLFSKGGKIKLKLISCRFRNSRKIQCSNFPHIKTLFVFFILQIPVRGSLPDKDSEFLETLANLKGIPLVTVTVVAHGNNSFVFFTALFFCYPKPFLIFQTLATLSILY